MPIGKAQREVWRIRKELDSRLAGMTPQQRTAYFEGVFDRVAARTGRKLKLKVADLPPAQRGPREMKLKQLVVTPSMGKRLIGKAAVVHPAVAGAMKNATLVITAGTTNGYVAEEVLAALGQAEGFTRKGFRRGMTLPPGAKAPAGEPACDVVIVRGKWIKGRELTDVAADLKTGDVILKGANALELPRRRAAVLVGHPQAGTIGVSLPAVIGRRVRLVVPVGLEKRVDGDLDEIAAELNDPQADGPRLLPMPGEVLTELEAVELLTGVRPRLVAAGGILGAEGAVWLAVRGSAKQLRAAGELIASVSSEPPCEA